MRVCGVVLGCLLAAGCATQEVSESGAVPISEKRNEPVAQSIPGNSDASPGQPQSEGNGSSGLVFTGTDQSVRMPPIREPIRVYNGDAVALNFEEAPLSEVLHSVVGDILGLDYIVEHPVKGTVTLRTRSPIPREQLLPIMESLLANNGALMVRGPQNRLFISGPQNASRIAPSFQNSAGTGTGFSNVIVPLQYIGAPEMAEILKPVATDSAFVRVDAKRNLLVLAGTQMQIDGWLDIVSTFDIDQLAGTSVGIFPISRGEVEDVVVELEHIMNSAAADGADSPLRGLGGMVRVLPVERLNSIMVVSPRAAYIDTVGDWIEQLDSIDEPASESTLHVYKVMNGDAAQMAMLLSTIFGDGAGGGQSSRQSQVAPGMDSQRSGGGGGANASSGQRAGGSSFALSESIKVVSDDYNNALLVYASPYEYVKIERILRKLDVIATQVLIEASIVEVTLEDDLQYGLEWTFQNGIGNDYLGTGSLNLSSGGGGIASQASGFAYTVTNSAGFTKAVLNALAEKSLLNVISTPSVLVLDNHTADISVGIQQPIQSRQSVTDGGVSQTSIEYKDTGVKLQVTPSVNDGGLVTLEVTQSVTDVGNIDTATRQRSFNERSVSSKVAVRDGDSVVLGGLIRDNASSGKSGVPLLMDIPVLGSLFSSTVDTSARTELLIFITPRVVESDEEVRALSIEMRDRMRGITNFDDLPVDLGD
jgi:general secretion pathway protein D